MSYKNTTPGVPVNMTKCCICGGTACHHLAPNMNQQYDILQQVKVRALRSLEEQEDKKIIAMLTATAVFPEEVKHREFQELCSKIKNKHRKK
jgi:succinate dehydrogenase flavin-adding protein (antitoxin of CptAB toxin-antitoxin module)